MGVGFNQGLRQVMTGFVLTWSDPNWDSQAVIPLLRNSEPPPPKKDLKRSVLAGPITETECK